MRERLAQRPSSGVHEIGDAAAWPFRRDVTPQRDDVRSGDVFWIRDLELAFPGGQRQGTRLVLTQSTYQLQRWLDWLEPHAALLVADADAEDLRSSSPEAFAERGPWSRIEMIGIGAAEDRGSRVDLNSGVGALHDAFSQPDAGRRLDAARRAAAATPADPALHLAVASALMELDQLDEAASVLEAARALAPDWEAVHFESGKLWLRMEDTERAASAFREAARLMPHFAAALLNLGGALGELDRRDEALAALHQALACDPHSHVAYNNIGAAHREDGRLDEAAAAFRHVIALAPAFVFGYYNLGHTLLLAGDFAAAREAYEDGFARDAQKNARQASRLAVARAAAGDAAGAVQLIEELGTGLPAERRREILEEAESTLEALSAIPVADAAAVSQALAAVRRYSS